jgi:hypothetical protein
MLHIHRGARVTDAAPDPPVFSRAFVRKHAAAFIIALIGASAALGTLAYTIVHEGPQDRAEQLRLCRQDHGLTKSYEEFAGEGDVRVFAACEWPPPAYADGDGYSEITVVSGEGPLPDEASGANMLNRIRATCETLELVYVFGSQGAFETLPPFLASAGAVVTYEGDPWEGPAPYPYPESDEIVVLKNSKYLLDTAKCTEAAP